MADATPIPPARPSSAKMLFLASHGFQSPISAIRWGCGRLRKMAHDMPPAQQELVDGMQRQAKTLSGMFDALLLLAKVEDGVHVPRMQDIYLKDFFLHSARLQDLSGDISVEVTCPDDARLRTDRTIFESVIQAALMAIDTAGGGPRSLAIDITLGGGACSIILNAPLEFSLVEDEGTRGKIVGGVPGLMLAVASSLTAAVGGSLDAKEGPKGHIHVRLPAPPSVSVLPE